MNLFSEIDEAAQCVVKVLEGCKDPTPANVVESVLKVVKKVIPCKSEKVSQDPVITNKITKSGSSSLVGPPMLLLGLLLAPIWFS